MSDKAIYLGSKALHQNEAEVQLQEVELNGELFYKIENSNEMSPFFMSIVSASNHWLFVSSNGALTAGRKNSEHALLPYYTDDKITEGLETTGSKTVFLVTKEGQTFLWEPQSELYKGVYDLKRNLYKNKLGNKVLFEEINHDLGLTYSIEWTTSDVFGFVRKSVLKNTGSSKVGIRFIDGLQNVLPYGVGEWQQMAMSNLVDAYKKAELEPSANIGVYALSSVIVDRAEPSEALKSNVVWSLGRPKAKVLISAKGIESFRKGVEPEVHHEVRAHKGAYLLNDAFTLDADQSESWSIIADLGYGVSEIKSLQAKINTDAEALQNEVIQDIDAGGEALKALVASADGLQCTSDTKRTTRHFANTLFNIMRGGVFDHNYEIESADLKNYIKRSNRALYESYKNGLSELPELISLQELNSWIAKVEDTDIERLCAQYLPLKFSRRHGDPSRPWNKFSINTKNELDGSKVLDFQGNWRDIFQNWEALVFSYPQFIEGMIHTFLNATTFEGYNPYRVTKYGFDWETIEPDNPWSYIGYWGDHQIIYLLKFLEFAENYQPGMLQKQFNRAVFTYADVPYRIKAYKDIVKDAKNTIDFDVQADHDLRAACEANGSDSALLRLKDQAIYKVNFMEKILATLLAKLSNFIPDAGIWMNTQRPEWNDANNALVGNGVSMVTLYYLRRFVCFFEDLLQSEDASVEVSEELTVFFETVHQIFEQNKTVSELGFSDFERQEMTNALGEAASVYRLGIYEQGFSGQKRNLKLSDIAAFTSKVRAVLEQSIRSNKREDGLYHAYNLMQINPEGISVHYLDEMLEGQVAVLSSGFLSSKEALEVLTSMRNSRLWREDQHSYILYPDKNLGLFLEKNTLPESAKSSRLLQEMLKEGNTQIVNQDRDGQLHFNGSFTNVNGLKEALDSLDDAYKPLVAKEYETICAYYEEVFNHKAFTGRSGTFFGYEGLGSIYWHMVSKLLLATQECWQKAIAEQADTAVIEGLKTFYFEINKGIGVYKTPENYGAFPTDPYSHTPAHKGAQQPGMTGQVKEDVISRLTEMGVRYAQGHLEFDADMLQDQEFIKSAQFFEYYDVQGQKHDLELQPNSLAFTICQTPIIYNKASANEMKVYLSDGEVETISGLQLSSVRSAEIFQRTGKVQKLEVNLKRD